MRKCQPSVAGDRRVDDVAFRSAALAGTDPRLVDVWCTFLGSLATDAEAALAAAMAYRELDGEARDVWIAALEQDMDRVTVPRIAIYAPLLAVEVDAARRQRLLSAIGPISSDATPRQAAYALAGKVGGPNRITAIIAPLYLDFVQVIACSFRLGEAFDWVKHDPIVERRHAPRPGECLNGVLLEATPLNAAVDDLAITVVAHARDGRSIPEALSVFADLFGPSAAEAPPLHASPP